MTVFTKRNAMIGWATWVVGKRIFRAKSKTAGPRARSRKTVAAAAAAVATIGGALLFWRRRRESSEAEPAEPQPTPTA